MDSGKPEISLEVLPYLRVYKDGTIERIAGTQVVPPGFDADTNVLSKDILIIPEIGVSARIYRPNLTNKLVEKLPLLIYFHGGAYCISSPSDTYYHNSLNKLVAEANIIAVSVGYRLAPEHPLPTAYEDSWAALHWVASHTVRDREGLEEWLKDYVDFERVFLAGDSAGANIAHHMALRLNPLVSEPTINLKIHGIVMVHPYFWGKEPIGVEISDPVRKAMVDTWWDFVCPSDKGHDDPLINPFVDGSPNLVELGCREVFVTVAEKDILRDRGKLYHKVLVNSGWGGTTQFYETEGEDHVFHIFNPNCEKAKSLIKCVASFINQDKLR
ncbi:Alpha/beta hydrolase-3 [Quillaja saponaria]|uniref:Alpha/beta hydrolase-3 n=1 Tax=Quillaja saponaria TaxID=32244 RepID=A0AAD7M021_QUISA|nr:Alpha/beta hydrolase-3 [Quillaja saponaria]